MPFLDHHLSEIETWRPDVSTRLLVAAFTGAQQLCQFEQCCQPGCGAPTHVHAVEEILTILAGEADVWIEADTGRLGPGQSALVAAGTRHGFRNVGTTNVHVLATLAAPIFEAAYDHGGAPRRWAKPEPPV